MLDRCGTLSLYTVGDEIVAAVRVLSRHRVAAVILWDPAVALAGGVFIDAALGRELVVTLFVPERINRLHGGAVIVRGDRVQRAVVPIAWTDVVERAADLGDGIAIAVDEDTGVVRVVDRAGRVIIVDVDDLAGTLREHALRRR